VTTSSARRKTILPCDALRAKIGEQWHPFSIKIDRPGQAPLFLNIDPKTAGFSGLIAEDAGIKLVLRVDAKTVLSTTELATTGGTLPPLDRASAAGGSLDVTLQAEAPYDFLKNELASALKGKTFTKDFYPSNGRLAVGLKIDAKTPGRWFNTAGWVYLSGTPIAAPGGKAVAVEDLAFATVLDSEFWNVVQGLFEGPSPKPRCLDSRSPPVRPHFR
jgi:Domain of unknown function (DUF4403)